MAVRNSRGDFSAAYCHRFRDVVDVIGDHKMGPSSSIDAREHPLPTIAIWMAVLLFWMIGMPAFLLGLTVDAGVALLTLANSPN